MPDLTYLPGVIAIIVVGYIIIVAAGTYGFGLKNLFANFTSTGTSCMGDEFNWVLLLFRVCCFSFFLGVTVIYDQIINPPNWWYFTLWNIYLTVVYFILTSISSTLTLWYGQDIALKLPNSNILSKLIVALYSCWGSTALFVTIINFSLLEPNMGFWNVCQHLVTSLCVILELILNDLDIQPIQYIWATSWIFLFVVFAWIVVGSGLRGWQYFFLDTGSESAFFWYPILFLLALVFFVVWYGLHRLKWFLVTKYNNIYKSSHHDIPELGALL